jgi:hypothetical protein
MHFNSKSISNQKVTVAGNVRAPIRPFNADANADAIA